MPCASGSALHRRPGGYRWKSLFLAQGSELRFFHDGIFHYAQVREDLLVCKGRPVSPRQFMLAVIGEPRNTWHAPWCAGPATPAGSGRSCSGAHSRPARRRGIAHRRHARSGRRHGANAGHGERRRQESAGACPAAVRTPPYRLAPRYGQAGGRVAAGLSSVCSTARVPSGIGTDLPLGRCTYTCTKCPAAAGTGSSLRYSAIS